MKKQKIRFTNNEVNEIYARAKVDVTTKKEVKRDILDRERDRRERMTEERRKRAIAARKARKEREQLQEESTTWTVKIPAYRRGS